MPNKKHRKNYFPYCFALILVLVVGGAVFFGCNPSQGNKKEAEPLKPAEQTEQIAKKVAEAPIPPKETPKEKPNLGPQVTDPEQLVPKQGENYSVLIDKSDFTLTLLDNGKPLYKFKVAIGKNSGQKQAVGDLRTPTGTFSVDEIDDASYWTHDFGDGKGVIEGAYGPWFISLETPGWSGIGIHGTHDPSSIGTCASEGCVRMNNDELRILKKFVHVGTKVQIQE
jgi:lipoprotein-anchoring transpeptidase ErfK/SrfK